MVDIAAARATRCRLPCMSSVVSMLVFCTLIS